MPRAMPKLQPEPVALDPVDLSALAAASGAAFFARAGDDQSVTADAKPMFSRHSLAQLQQLGTLELNQLIEFDAVEMVVLRISVVRSVEQLLHHS